jgi:hypothetical protein
MNEIYVTERLTMLHLARLPVVLTNGNEGRDKRWYSSAKIRTQIEYMLRLNGHFMPEPFNEPIVLRITRVLARAQKLWDSDSIGRGNAKELVDSLVACNWFRDDSAAYITETRFAQFIPLVREKMGSTIVEVLRVEQIQGANNDTTTEI